jgi:hypothetical protein
VDKLQAMHARYFTVMDALVTAVNKKLGKPAVVVIPVGQVVPGILLIYPPEVAAALNPLLQETAWDADTGHPLGGVKKQSSVHSPGADRKLRCPTWLALWISAHLQFFIEAPIRPS